jgi:hypothetical protein
MSCGETLALERVELGYQYCLKDECQKLCMEPVRLARVAVNKSADQFVRADDVLPTIKPSSRRAPDDDLPDESEFLPRVRAHQRAPRRVPSPLQRLRAISAGLDHRLAKSYEQFCRGEITAAEMAREQNALIDAFNGYVRRENIRYHGMIRKRV